MRQGFGKKAIEFSLRKVVSFVIIFFVVIFVIASMNSLKDLVIEGTNKADELCDSYDALKGFCKINEADIDITTAQGEVLQVLNKERITRTFHSFHSEQINSLIITFKRAETELFILEFENGIWRVEGKSIPPFVSESYVSFNTLSDENERLKSGIEYLKNNIVEMRDSYSLNVNLLQKEGEGPLRYSIEYTLDHKEDGIVAIEYIINTASNDKDKIAQKFFSYENYDLEFNDFKGQGSGLDVTKGKLDEDLYSCFEIVYYDGAELFALKNYDLFCSNGITERSSLSLKEDSFSPKLSTTIKSLKTQKVGDQNALDYLFSYSKERGIDPYLSLSILTQESLGNPQALSFVGAGGLMQLMPQTASERLVGLEVPNYDLISVTCVNKNGAVFYRSDSKKVPACNTCDVDTFGNKIYAIGGSKSQCDLKKDERFDVQKGIEGGVNYLLALKSSSFTQGKTTLIIAAYNGGFKAIQQSEVCPGQLSYECEKNQGYAETRTYVKEVSSFYDELSFSNRES